MTKLKNFLKNEYVFSVTTKIIMVVLGLLHSVLVARYLGSTLKGQISYIESILSVGSIVLTLGIHHAYTYYRKRTNDELFLNKYMNSILLLFSMYLIICVLSSILSRSKIEISIALLFMPLWGYTRVAGTVLLVEEPNKRNLTALIFGVLENIYVLLLFLFSKSNLTLGVSVIVFVQLCQATFYTFFIHFRFNYKYIDIKLLKSVILYGLLPMISLLMTTLNYRLDIMMLKSSANVLLSGIGIYSVGVGLAEKALLVPDAIKEILLSKLAKGSNESEVAVVSRISFLISILVALMIVLLGKPLISVLYGAEYDGAYEVTLIGVAGTVFMVFFKMICQYNIVNKKQLTNVILLSAAIIINVICNYLFIPIWGINGAAVATVIGHFVSAGLFVAKFSKESGISVSKIVFIQKSDISSLKDIVSNQKRG